MNQIKKFAAVGGVVCLIAGWPLVVGQIAQTVITDSVKKIHNKWVEGKILTYDRGYLHARVETELKVVDAGLKAQLQRDGLPTSYIFSSELTHGLVAINAETRVKDYPGLPLAIKTRTQLNGNTSFALDTKTISYRGERWRFSTAPAAMNGSVTTLGEWVYQLDIPSIQLGDSDVQFKLDNVHGNGQGKKENYFWIGSQALQADKAVMVDMKTQDQFVVEKLNYKNESDLNESHDRFNNHQFLEVDRFIAPDGELHDLNIEFLAGDLDTQGLSDAAQVFENYAQPQSLDQTRLAAALERLFQRGFFLALQRFDIGFSHGRIQSKLKLIFPAGLQNVTREPGQIIQNVTGNVEAAIPQAASKRNPEVRQWIDELVTMKLVQEDGEQYRMKAAIKDGNLVFESGQKIPLLSILTAPLTQ
jgi:uncharacterized protein YdgA (DUF945 family)